MAGQNTSLPGTPQDANSRLSCSHLSSETPVLIPHCREAHPGPSVALGLNLTSLEPVYESPETHLLPDVAAVQHGGQCCVLEERQQHG